MISTTIPRSQPAGIYPISAHCGLMFARATLEVRAAPTTPTTTHQPMAPTPPDPPADPPVTQPQPPAPMVAGPATPPTSLLASRGILPGLAAVVSGALAALGGWLLYRRRHLAYPSRQTPAWRTDQQFTHWPGGLPGQWRCGLAFPALAQTLRCPASSATGRPG